MGIGWWEEALCRNACPGITSRLIVSPLTDHRDERVALNSEINYASLLYSELNRGKRGFHIHHPGAARAT